MNLDELLVTGKTSRPHFEKVARRLKKVEKRKLDDTFHQLHTRTFNSIDCLKCANCCKTTSPIFRDADIKRLSKSLRIKETAFISQYLYVDSEGDYVLNTAPCPFLDHQNACTVYEDRPLACREYPHTDRKNMFQILNLTRKNMEVCPAVSHIMQEIDKKF